MHTIIHVLDGKEACICLQSPNKNPLLPFLLVSLDGQDVAAQEDAPMSSFSSPHRAAKHRIECLWLWFLLVAANGTIRSNGQGFWEELYQKIRHFFWVSLWGTMFLLGSFLSPLDNNFI